MKWTMVMTAVLFAAPAWSQQTEALPEPVLDIGREYYVQYCASCHGERGRGDGPVAGVLDPKPADLTRIAARRGGRFPAAEVSKIIDGRSLVAAHGMRDMPVWGRTFSEEVLPGETGQDEVRGRLLLLVEYLRSIQR